MVSNLLAKSAEELTEIRRHKMGMVFQSFGLMPHLNVIDNVAFPLKLQGIEEKSRYAQAERVIELVGLNGRESTSQMSCLVGNSNVLELQDH